MENIKVKVNSEEESKEAQELFFEMGYRWIDIGTVYYKTSPSFNYITAYCNGKTLAQGHGLDAEKEITIPQLRDLVVLKRNDVDDATHENCMFPYIKLTDGWYYFDYEVKKWLKSTGGKPEYFEKLKPIERGVKMKEYLDPDNEYALITADDEIKGDSDWIEVPEGADFLVNILDDEVFYKQGTPFTWWNGDNWVLCVDLVNKETFSSIIWQRTPSVDDAETHTRENNHYFIDVSDVDEIDFYEIAKRYNVTDPAVQHILKKCLAVGGRGHKDLETDLKDILKTAKRALAINGFS